MVDPVSTGIGMGTLSGAKVSTLVAGTIGSAISLRFAKDLTPTQKITSVVAGAFMAHYIAPVVAEHFALQSYEDTLGFLIGVFGLSLCAALIDAIKKAHPWGLIVARYGNPKDPEA